ncbi:hypothetical protein EZS27_037525 [termite gut metagenome]|uniref:IrrE N-terminal-like domain-containing protein n=1 Tax=termite gut metagenome TaxID=433724 RepID=A0A5J4PQU2_9ZZZZ
MVKVDFDAIAIEALNFRNDCFISSHEPINCKNLLLQLNVLTLYRPLSNNFSGMCLKSNEKKFILVNSNHSRGRQHFTIAHEFYHLFLEQSFYPRLFFTSIETCWKYFRIVEYEQILIIKIFQ